MGLHQNSNQVRFVRVPDRNKKTLNAVVSRYVSPGSHITTDLWGGYNDLEGLGYIHTTVIHTENYVDLTTGSHTQEIEVVWNTVKAPYKRMRGNRTHLQSHLDEASWRLLRLANHNIENLFDAFIEDLRTVHGQLKTQI